MPDENKPVDADNINYTTNTYSSNDDSEEISEEVEEDNVPPIELNEEFIKPKKNILLKVLYGIIALLFLLLIIGTILYFTDFFKPEEVKQPEKAIDTQTIQKVEPQDSYKFDIRDINSKKLNEELANLTNKNLNNDKIDEIEKNANEKKLVDEQKQKEDDLLKQNEDDLLKQKTELEEKKQELEKQKAELESMKQQALLLKNELSDNTKVIPSEKGDVITFGKNKNEDGKIENSSSDSGKNSDGIKKETNNEFLLFINVAKIKGVLYKKYLDKITAINPNIKLCRDDKNRIEIYYGPFEKSEDRTELLNKLITNKFNEAYELEFTQEEFDKRCNY